MQLENSKGTRDIPPEEKIQRDSMVRILSEVFELYGYSPLETPIIERYDLMLAKGGSGEESDVLKEVYKLTDQGGRKLGLRFELTLSFARFVGMNPNLKMPFKRYEIGPCFRDGPIKLGRYRQFLQCDVDVVGSIDMAMDAEMICLAQDVFKRININAYIKINSRKILKGMIEYANIPDNLASEVIISIDKLDKVGVGGVEKELQERNIPESNIQNLTKCFSIEGSTEEKLVSLKSLFATRSRVGMEGVEEMEKLLSFLSEEQKKNVVFNVTLARGQGYYTGTLFEGYAKNSKVTSSICGGGRYDGMIGALINSDKVYPCVGISFGLDTITDVLKESVTDVKKTVVQLYVIPIKTQKECFSIAKKLRDSGISIDMDYSGKGISKNLDYANGLGIPFVIIVGPKELEQGKVSLKDMKSGTEQTLSIRDVIKIIKKLTSNLRSRPSL